MQCTITTFGFFWRTYAINPLFFLCIEGQPSVQTLTQLLHFNLESKTFSLTNSNIFSPVVVLSNSLQNNNSRLCQVRGIFWTTLPVLTSTLLNGQIKNGKQSTVKMLPGSVFLCPGPVPGPLGWAYPEQLGLSSTACGLALGDYICPCTNGVSLLHRIASMAPLSKPQPCTNNVPYTSGTTWSTRSDGFG